MKERPILFSAPMVRAILEGRKTQTRRVVKLKYAHGSGDNRFVFSDAEGKKWFVDCPYGEVGDRLYVRETWQHSSHPYGPLDESCAIFYRADYFNDPHGMDGEKSPEGKYREWRPSIHMPRWASRIDLEITGVGVERLNAISESDAKHEGADTSFEDKFGNVWAQPQYKYGFRKLWESINGAGSWNLNPWVWVIEFKRVENV